MEQAPSWSPVPEPVPQMGPVRATPRAVGTAWGLFAGAFIAVTMLYPFAVSFIDRPAPETTPAALLFVVLLAAWIPAVLATRSAQPEHTTKLLVIALGAALPAAMFAVSMQEQAYGWIGFVAMILFVGIPLFVLVGIGLIVALVVATRGDPPRAVRTVHLTSLWLLGVVSLTAAWLLLTLPRQADLARTAHTPGPAIVAFLALLVALLILARRT